MVGGRYRLSESRGLPGHSMASVSQTLEVLGILQQLKNLVPPTKLTRFKWLAVELRKVQCNGPRWEIRKGK